MTQQLREWSLIKGRGGGLQNGREGGGASEVILTKTMGGGGVGAGKVLAIPKGGTKSCGVVLTPVLEVLTILERGGHKR